MDRNMKWHIYGPDREPLCWNGKALEFDSDSDASEFLDSAISNAEYDIEIYSDAVIEHDILNYEKGFLNATNLRVSWNPETCETILINI